MSTNTTVKMTIPIARPFVGKEEEEAVVQALRSGWLSQGPRVGEFEARFAEFCGVAHAVATNNGTSALHLCLVALGVGPGDEVIVPTLTYVATGNVVRYCGATPVLVDSEPLAMTIDWRRSSSSATR